MNDTDLKPDLHEDGFTPARKNPRTDKDKFEEMIELGFSPEEIAEMQDRAFDGAIDDQTGEKISTVPKEELEKIDLRNSQADGGDFYKEIQEGGPSKLRAGAFMKRHRTKMIGLGFIVLLGGGGFGIFGILAGPLQFVQIAKMLQNFHFSNQEDISDDRMTKMARYLRYHGDERTRLSILGNAYANKIEARMNRSGIKSEYDRGKLLTNFDGYSIKLDEIPESSELSELKDVDENRAKSILSEKYKVPLDNIDFDGGTNSIRIRSEGLGYFGSRSLIKLQLQEAGYSKIGSAIRSRIMGRRAGIEWRPIKRLDQKILTAVQARLEWGKAREERITNGARDPPTLRAGADIDLDGDGVPEESSMRLKDAANQANTATSDLDGSIPVVSEGKVAAVKTKLNTSVKAAGVATAVLGIVCLADALRDDIDDVKQANLVEPLERIGVGEGIAIGNQIITGQHVDIQSLDFHAEKLHTEEDGSWRSARSIQAELGEEQTGPDIGPEAKIDNGQNALSQVLDLIPGVNGICDVVNSTIGQIVTTTIDVIQGPFGALASAAFGQILGPKIMDGFARWVAGHPLDLLVAGANYGNYINYGAKLAANDSIISGGGVLLGVFGVKELKEHQIATEKEERESKSIFARLLDPTDINSPVGTFMSEQNPDPAQNIARVASGMPKTMASIFKLPSIFIPKAQAASNYSYGFGTYGYSMSEINNESVKNPFENSDLAAKLLRGQNGQSYRERAKDCFGIDIGTDPDLTVKSTGKAPAYNKMPANCTDGSLEWLRVRFYILDSQTMEAYACYEDGQNDTCKEFDLDSGSDAIPAISEVIGATGSNTTDIHYDAITTTLPGCPYSGPVGGVRGMQPGVTEVQSLVNSRWGGGTRSGFDCRPVNNGSGSGKPSPHAEGRAIDSFFNALDPAQQQKGNEVFGWLIANAQIFGLQYAKFYKLEWSPSKGVHCNDSVADINIHTSHIHYELNWDGALKKTPYFTGTAPSGTVVKVGQNICG